MSVGSWLLAGVRPGRRRGRGRRAHRPGAAGSASPPPRRGAARPRPWRPTPRPCSPTPPSRPGTRPPRAAVRLRRLGRHGRRRARPARRPGRARTPRRATWPCRRGHRGGRLERMTRRLGMVAEPYSRGRRRVPRGPARRCPRSGAGALLGRPQPGVGRPAGAALLAASAATRLGDLPRRAWPRPPIPSTRWSRSASGGRPRRGTGAEPSGAQADRSGYGPCP